MDRIEYKFPEEYRDRPLPPGPWDDEPDKVQWPDAKTGLACMIRRGPLGSWCGYVGVPDTHPLYRNSNVDFNVHGGITYGSLCDGDEEHGICHVPGPGEPEPLWWFGFDCGHAFDLSPGMMRDFIALSEHQTYRDQAYVTAEVEKLALQLALAA